MYTEKLGKITVIAKGAKKNSNKLFSSSLPFCFGEYLLFKGKNLYTLNEGRLINSLQGLLSDLEKLTDGSYLFELMDIAIVEEESNRMLFREFVSSLYLLDTEVLDYELLTRSFELKLLKATGYGLELNNCALCRKSNSLAKYC